MTSSQQPLSGTPLPAITGENWPEFQPGWVWLAGAGPGDPGLVTLHVLNALQQADVVIYDALIDSRILDWVRPGATIEYAGKRGGKPSPKQRDISIRLIELAQQGMRVLRLKGGDPFVFGRGGEEAQTLVQANIPLRILPGISAGIGGLAYAGIPVTHRDVNQSVTFVTDDLIASGGDDNRIVLWRISDGVVAHILEGHQGCERLLVHLLTNLELLDVVEV